LSLCSGVVVVFWLPPFIVTHQSTFGWHPPSFFVQSGYWLPCQIWTSISLSLAVVSPDLTIGFVGSRYRFFWIYHLRVFCWTSGSIWFCLVLLGLPTFALSNSLLILGLSFVLHVCLSLHVSLSPLQLPHPQGACDRSFVCHEFIRFWYTHCLP